MKIRPPALPQAPPALAAIVLLAGPACPAAAQEETPPAVPEAGFLEVVNLVSLAAPTRIHLGAFGLNRGEPVPAGGGSGVLAVRPGEYEFTLVNEEADPPTLTGTFPVADGRNTVVICYDAEEEGRGGETAVRLRYTLLTESPDGEGPRLTLVSLAREPSLSLTVGGERVALPRHRAHQHPVALGDTVRLVHQGRLVEALEIESPVHHIGFLFPDPASDRIELSLIRSEKLEYHPPLEDEEGADTASGDAAGGNPGG